MSLQDDYILFGEPIQEETLDEANNNIFSGKKDSEKPEILQKNERIMKYKDALADSLARCFSAEPKRAQAIKICGSVMYFRNETDRRTGKTEKNVQSGNFCKNALCPICSRIDSNKKAARIALALKHLKDEFPSMRFVFLTLTVRSCKPENLKDTLDQMLGGSGYRGGWPTFRSCTLDRILGSCVIGAIRTVEITYNSKEDTMHPHIHVLLAVTQDYYDNVFLETPWWVHRWRKAMHLNYDPVCDIRSIKPKDIEIDYLHSQGKWDREAEFSAAAEVAKYSVKHSDFVKLDDPDMTDRVVSVLYPAIFGRRLFSASGCLKTAYAWAKDELKASALAHMQEVIEDPNIDLWFELFKCRNGVYYSCGEVPDPDFIDAKYLGGIRPA